MFSGIVEAQGKVVSAERAGAGRRLGVDTGLQGLALGESVAVNGVCLTVSALEGERADFYLSAETLGRSTLDRVDPGDPVNLERAVTLGTRLSGHLVQGHVDGRARLTGVDQDGEARRIALTAPAVLRPYCVLKGSIALNGVSLTLNAVGEVSAGVFEIAITLVPHTWSHTNFSRLAVGDELNVEVDVLAKYVESLCRPYQTPSGP